MGEAGSERTVRWGILGAGNIAHRFARALAHEQGSELVAISARSPQKAEAFAREFGVDPAHAYTDADGINKGHYRLLADEGVDAVYLALPHRFHLRWAEEALRAGKAVLCEKPAALDAEQMRRIASVSLATGRLFMEAMKTRFEPAYQAVRDLVSEGAIGELERVEARLCNDVPAEVWKSSSYYLAADQGGALLDTGIYCAGWIDDFLPGAVSVQEVDVTPYERVDLYDRAELRVGASTALLECAFDRPGGRAAVLVGTKGRIVVDDLHRPEGYTIELDGEAPRTVQVPYEVDDFYPQIKHFADLVRAGEEESPVVPLASSLRMIQILDEIRVAAGRR